MPFEKNNLNVTTNTEPTEEEKITVPAAVGIDQVYKKLIDSISQNKSALIGLVYELLSAYKNSLMNEARNIMFQNQREETFINIGKSVKEYEDKIATIYRSDFDDFSALKKVLGID